jgi:hypothetical protein
MAEDNELKVLMKDLLKEITTKLHQRIVSGKYNDKDVQAALKLLKDNSITVDVQLNVEGLEKDDYSTINLEDLPFEEDELRCS